jgi:hypothetical protein
MLKKKKKNIKAERREDGQQAQLCFKDVNHRSEGGGGASLVLHWKPSFSSSPPPFFFDFPSLSSFLTA